MTPIADSNRARGRLYMVPLAFAGVALVVQLTVMGRYGIFRDEFYYLACARHLDWGYIDQPPLSIALLAGWTALFGDGILALRIPAVLAGAATVFCTGLLAREMGGKRFAQAMACLSVLIAPVFLAVASFYSMNVFDQLFWVLLALILVRCLNTENPRWWLLFGFVAGLGLQNKISVLFLGAGVVAGLILTRYRTHLLRKELWIGGVLALLLFLPYILWQVPRDFPTVDFMQNAATLKNTRSSPVQLFLGMLLELHPANAVVWIPGLAFTLYGTAGKRYRLLGVAFLTIFLILAFTNGKVYYVAPAMPILFALGGVAWEDWTRRRPRWRLVVIAPLLVLGPVLAPLAIPVLSPENFIVYQERLGIAPPPMERNAPSVLPQHFADRFGWRELAKFIDRMCTEHLPDERGDAVVLASNYGEAGALQYYRDEFNLPPVISPHNNYHLWGPGQTNGKLVLVYGWDRAQLELYFRSVEETKARFQAPYIMPYQNDRPLYICRYLKKPLRDLWPMIKMYI